MKDEINILLVDDEHSLLDQANIFLEKEEKLNVITASSAEEGLDLLDEEDIEVIVSDYQMPEMDGLEFLEEVRKKKEMDIPFIIFTGKGREEVAMKALNLGADRYLQKGGDPKSQYGVLTKAIQQEYEFYKKEKELEKSEQEKSIILERTSDAIAYHDSEHNIIWANRTYLEGAGTTLKEMKGKKCYEAWYGRDEPCEGCPTDEALKSGEVEKGEIFPPEGDRVWLITATPIKNEEGNVERIIESSLDITEIKEKEKKIKKLYEASIGLKDCTSEREIYEKVLKSAEDILGLEACTILMEEEDDLVVKASKAKNVEDGEKYSKDEGIRGLTFQNKKSYIIEDISESEAAKPSDPDYESAISIPIGKEGLFQALSFEKGYFDESDLYLAEILISHLVKSIEQIRSQEELRKNTERYETLFKDNPEAIVEVNDDFEVVQVNEKFKDLFGYEEDEILGRNLKYLVVPSNQIDEANRLGEQCEEGNHVEHETVRLTKDGEEVDVAITARPTKYLDERHHVVVYKDITEQKEIEEELKRKEVYLEHTPEFITVIDEQGEVKYWNHPSSESDVFDPSEILSSSGFEFIHPEDREEAQEMFSEALQNPDEEFKVEVRGKTKEGWRWFEAIAVNCLNDSEIEGIIISGRDVTERKRAKGKLKRNKTRHETLFEENPEAVVELDEEIRIVNVNENFENLFGYDEEEILGKNINDLIVPNDRLEEAEKLDELDKRSGKGYLKYETVRMTNEGEKVPVIITSNPIEQDGVTHHLAVYKDISERKRVEKQREKGKKKLEELHRISAKLETCQSEDEVYSYAVEAAEEILEFDLCGFDAVEGDKFVPKAISSDVPEEGYVDREIEEGGISKKTYLNQNSYLIDDLTSDEDSKPVKSEYRSLISVPIGKYGIFQAVSTEPNHFDEEDMKMAEILIDHLKEALKRIEMKGREEFLHSLLRHDVQNKTQVVNGYLHLLEEYDDIPDEAKEYIEKARNATRASDEIIEKVRKLRQIEQEDEIEEIDIGSVLEAILSEHKSQLEKENIGLEIEGSGCKVKGGTLLEEMFSNLIENSILHSDCDKIRIRFEPKEDECIVTVEDDGKGITDDVKEKIFEKGFKKGENAGSGLGMYLAKEIGESYDGNVEVKDSELGGARFDVYLKRVQN